MRVTLTMDEETARTVMRATEFYARVVCGHYEIIADDVMGVREGREGTHTSKIPEVDERQLCRQRSDAEVMLMQAKHMQFPELKPTIGHHWGLGYSRKTDIAYNTYQAIRFAFMQMKSPDKDLGDWDKPTARVYPYPMVEIDGKEYLEGHFDVPETVRMFGKEDSP